MMYGLDGVDLIPASNERVISIDDVRDGVYQIALFQSRAGCVGKGMSAHIPSEGRMPFMIVLLHCCRDFGFQ